MSFSGKKFRRTGCENVEQLVMTNGAECLERVMQCKAPTICYTRLEDDTFAFSMRADDKSFSHTFRLGKEFEIESTDGRKIKVTYTLQDDNVLCKTLKYQDGKLVYFRNTFDGSNSVMTVRIEGSTAEAKIFYAAVQ